MKNCVKICGITSIDDAEMVLSFSNTQPEYLGFVFFEKSKRYISPENAKEIVEKIKQKFGENRVKFVGVFVNIDLNNSEIFEEYKFLDVLQLHGDNNFETPEFCAELQKTVQGAKNSYEKKREIWKAFRVKTQDDLKKISPYFMVDSILIDAFSEVTDEYGGSGKQVSLELLPYLRSYLLLHQKLFIAGGINNTNKDKILSLSGADGIDLSSSVEFSAGKKSEKKVQNLLFTSPQNV